MEIILLVNDDSGSSRIDDSLLELEQTSKRLKIEAVSELELKIESNTDGFLSLSCLRCLVLVDFGIYNPIPLFVSLWWYFEQVQKTLLELFILKNVKSKAIQEKCSIKIY